MKVNIEGKQTEFAVFDTGNTAKGEGKLRCLPPYYQI